MTNKLWDVFATTVWWKYVFYKVTKVTNKTMIMNRLKIDHKAYDHESREVRPEDEFCTKDIFWVKNEKRLKLSQYFQPYKWEQLLDIIN